MTLFAEFFLAVRPRTTHVLPDSTSRYLHALVFRLISDSDPKTARRVHASAQKPFTMSRIIGPIEQSNGQLLISEDKVYGVRVTSYDDSVSRAIIETLSSKYATGEPISLWREDFEVQEFALASRNGYPAMIESDDIPRTVLDTLGKAPEKIELSFNSPTAFKKGNSTWLFPEPRTVFQSVIQKFSANGVFESAEECLEAAEAISVQKYHLSTSVLRYRDVALPGFKGTITYNLSHLSENERLMLASVAYAANYTGIGMKTTMGMGQAHMVLAR